MSFTVPGTGQGDPGAAGAWQEPEIRVPVSVIGDAAELMALVAETGEARFAGAAH
jgi:hypothetical protein